MNGDAIPVKQVEISALSVTDKKARWLFIMADGKRTLSQIYQQCKLDEHTGRELVGLLVSKGYLAMNAEAVSSSGKSSTLELPADFEEIVTRELANFVGPVAPMLVGRINYTDAGGDREQLKELLKKLSLEIDGFEERERFLTSILLVLE